MRGAALGYQVVDADGRKYLLKLDPVGHLGMASAAELTGTRIFHAAGYNVPSNFVLDLGPDDLTVDPEATFSLYEVQKRPLTAELVRQRLTGAARTPDGRLRAVAVSWVPGKVAGRVRHERAAAPTIRTIASRTSIGARCARAGCSIAWLGVFDASAINTLDSYVEDGPRHYVRHYLIDFGAGLGSATIDVEGPARGRAAPHRDRPIARDARCRSVSTAVTTRSRRRRVAATVLAAPADRLVPGRDLRRRGVPHQPQGPRPHAA